MRLDPQEFRFGGAQKFPIRFAWLTKGVRAIEGSSRAFELETATVDLGVGSAMVKSIKYWLQACQLLDKKSGGLTKFGSSIFSSTEGWDPYLEDDGTIWLLHWLLASNSIDATAFFWFFNFQHQSEFSSEEFGTALRDFVTQNLRKRAVSVGTLSADSSVLLRMYSQSKIEARTPLEDTLDSPFSSLGLVSKSSAENRYISRFSDRLTLPNLILGYAVLSVMKAREVDILPVEDLMYSKDDFAAPGTVFRLSEDALIRKLEELCLIFHETLEVRESNGINQLFVKNRIDPEVLVQSYYEKGAGELAA